MPCLQEVDLAAAPLYVTEQREEVVDFTVPFVVVEAAILLRKPPTGNDVRIRDAADLLRHPSVRYGSLNTGLILRALRTANDTLHRRLYAAMRRFQPPTMTATNEEGIERVRADADYAFVLPHTIADYVSRRPPCDLVAVDRFLMRERFALAVTKASGLRVQLNRALTSLLDDGTVERLYAKWLLDASQCNGIHSSKMYSSAACGGGCRRWTCVDSRTAASILVAVSACLTFTLQIR